MTLFTAFGAFAGAGAAAAPADAFDFITSVSISTNDTHIANVFSADYDSYLVKLNCYSSANADDFLVQLSASGSHATAADYRRQAITANGSTLSASRTTGDTWWVFQIAAGTGGIAARVGFSSYVIQHPYATTPTVAHGLHQVAVDGTTRANASSYTHDLTTSYDGIRLLTSTGTPTGDIQFYGWKL